MNAGAIIAIIVIVAASGVLMMRFRKRWLAKINIILANRITSLFAGWLPVRHRDPRGSQVGEGLPNSSEHLRRTTGTVGEGEGGSEEVRLGAADGSTGSLSVEGAS